MTIDSQRHAGPCIQITDVEKMTYFGNITGPRGPVSSALFILADSYRHFSKDNAQYFLENYVGLVKLLA